MIRVTSKSQLVECLSGVQIVLLACALFGFGWWVKAKVGTVIRSQIIEANQLVAEQIGRLLMTIESEALAFGDSNWEQFQTIVEETKLPNNGTSVSRMLHPVACFVILEFVQSHR